eukprot:gnl/TRDRNA2_/TRDRNA2_73100_c0_seq2.p1 gnl/TRDRNA2_/TRDRNA2_73100_c0~~gnl/TRDRNA2_/TRDRNA2_73100_c0_seq2.p1  ORF type:complete len:207 (+),score=27.61 gnl/TRDRNA2_/TRDRNA2_73100_c0_seq2:63-683(+)
MESEEPWPLDFTLNSPRSYHVASFPPSCQEETWPLDFASEDDNELRHAAAARAQVISRHQTSHRASTGDFGVEPHNEDHRRPSCTNADTTLQISPSRRPTTILHRTSTHDSGVASDINTDSTRQISPSRSSSSSIPTEHDRLRAQSMMLEVTAMSLQDISRDAAAAREDMDRQNRILRRAVEILRGLMRHNEAARSQNDEIFEKCD